MKRRNTVLPDPQGAPSGAPKDAVVQEFARKLQAEMVKKGWNQSDVARHATLHMPAGKKIDRDMISHYVNGKHLPNAERVAALAKAFGIDKGDLLASRGLMQSAKITPPVDVQEMTDGRVWLRVNQAIDWGTALKILSMLKGEDAR